MRRRSTVRCGILHPFPRGEQAQSLIEMALIMPVFFMLTFGLINFALVLFNMGLANFASRAALRYATTHSLTSYFPATQQGLNNIVAPYVYQYPANTYSVRAGYYNSFTGGGTNVVGEGVCVTFTITYPFTVLGTSYRSIAYTSTGCSIIMQ